MTVTTNPRKTGVAPAREPSIVKAFGANVPVATDRDGIAQAQQLVGAGNLTLNGAGVAGGVYECGFTGGRKITAYSGGDIHTVTFTVTGTDKDGAAQTETLTNINNSTITGTKYFATVTSVAADAAVGSNVEIGFAASLLCLFLRDGDIFDFRPTAGEAVLIAIYGATGAGFGDSISLKIVNPATGTITWADGTTPSDARTYFPNGSEPVLTVSGTDWLEFVSISDAASGDTIWYGFVAGEDLKA